MKCHPYLPEHVLKKGKLYVHGEHRFLKTGKPLRDFSDPDETDQLIADLPIILEKGYNNLALNCYWHHFNPCGDGRIEKSLKPLKRLIEAIHDAGVYVSLSIETYGVGGGQVPQGFWRDHPEAVALNHEGKSVKDTEYGFKSAVPSIFNQAYQDCSRRFMKALLQQLGPEQFLYLETTVEPQYMGNQWIDFSDSAKREFAQWQSRRLDFAPSPFPEAFPIDRQFREDPGWNLFRAHCLAEWVNGDASALREGAGGKDLWIAVDYLDAEEEFEIRRCGNPLEFLRRLSGADIIQLNWSWCNILREPNNRAYERVRKVMKEKNRNWALTEHMTINGADYSASDMVALLNNTLHQGTRFGWEFVDIAADKDSADLPPNAVRPGDFKPAHFSVYDENWDPKPPMAVVDRSWSKWLSLAKDEAPVEVSTDPSDS